MSCKREVGELHESREPWFGHWWHTVSISMPLSLPKELQSVKKHLP